MDIYKEKGLKSSYCFIIIILIIILDQFSKYWIISNFSIFDYYIVNDFFNIVRAHNTGAAFGILSQYGGWQIYFLSTVAIIVSGVIFYYLIITPAKKYLLLLALTFIASGAIGNTLDRFFYGSVVDFLDFHILEFHWPAFNVADIAIFIGAILFILDSLQENRQKK